MKSNNKLHDKNNKILSQSFEMIKILLDFSGLPSNTRKAYDRCLDHIQQTYNTQGPKGVINLLKTSRLLVLSDLAEGQSGVKQSSTWLKTNKNKLPKWLGSVTSLSTYKDPAHLRVLLSLLFISRWLESPGKADLSPIITGKRSQITNEFREYLDTQTEFLRNLNPIHNIPEPSFYSTTKSGPNGPALINSVLDSTLITTKDRDHYTRLSQCIGHSDNTIIHWNRESKSVGTKPHIPVKRKLVRRRLIEIPDKEGKVRIVAVGSYWDQALLKSLHTGLNTSLKKIPEDCTFNQNNFVNYLKPDLFGKESFLSVDLKGATDQMPSNWQALVLSRLFGNRDLGCVWHEMVAEQVWTYGDMEVKYASGQPMGLYSSWPIMALTHHMLIRFSFHRIGKDPSGSYSVLGDDALIIGDEALRSYLEVLESAGIPINKDKSFISSVLVEFAKRFFYKGVEITPFPIGATLSSNGDPAILSVAMDNAFHKCWELVGDPVRSTGKHMFVEVFRRIYGKPKAFALRLSYILELNLWATETYRMTRNNSREGPRPSKRWRQVTGIRCSESETSLISRIREGLKLVMTHKLQTLREATDKSLVTLNDELLSHPVFRDAFRSGGDYDLPIIYAIQGLHTEIVKSMDRCLLARCATSAEEWDEEISEVMNLCISPIPSLDTWVHQEKGSARRARILSDIAPILMTWTQGEYHKLDTYLASFSEEYKRITSD